MVRAPSAIREGFVSEWRGAKRRALPYENNAHSYGLTVATSAQSKINMPFFGLVGYQTDAIASSTQPELWHVDQAAIEKATQMCNRRDLSGRQLAAMFAYQRVMIGAHDPGT